MDDRTDRFARVFEAGYRPLLEYARRRTAGVAEADDVVAEVLAIAWRRLDDVPPGAELAWLYGVARRVLANERRGAARRRRLLERAARLRPVADPADADADAEPGPGGGVLAALGRLPAGDREILRLAAWEGLEPRDIAVVLGCSANAAALRLSRARRRLRRQLTGSDGIRTRGSWRVTDA
ncbi:MAG TPA: sigma-70 family RNA polymerase sigma factor [Acidimicrobiales bacterium]|nr:sigma-70 family RNA polymerase sigma factor [Acidimicrobiales bacterium]